ncbi:anti-sigma factor [Tuberibacillus calidus]|uniref:anti-sigma factor n=1 Tax=Tuberibacillus calidus TaxID=340097 RepID=UPI0009D6BE6A|nr:anti-sigma factor [Tuberibacillus calidus]
MMTAWNKELEKRILKRSRFTLSFRILRILVIVVLLYSLYMMVVHIAADKFNIGNENMYYSSLALEWTVPNVRGDFDMKDETTTAFGTKRFSYDLLKKVGSKDVVVGEAQVTKRLFSGVSHISYSHPGLKNLSDFSFSLPEDPRNHRKLEASPSPDVWETLKKLPEGTVGELAFSTPTFMDAEKLVANLRKYDIHILWMPLYTGEFVNFKPSWSGGDNTIEILNIIGLTGGMNHDNNYRPSLRINWLDESTIKESKHLMLKNMKELLSKSQSYYEDFLGLQQLKERYRFLEDHGFLVYGAVVTGPVKELLKLKDDPYVQGAQLGDVELWNWEKE